MGMIGEGKGGPGNKVIKMADLILALGLKFDYLSTRFNFDIIPERAKIIHVSINPEEVGSIYPIEIGMVCDVGQVINVLTAKSKEKGIRFGLKKTAEEIKGECQRAREAEIDFDSLPLKPQAIVKTLRDHLPPETAIAVDGGNFAKYVRRHFDFYENDTYHYPDNFGSVGASFPMALGLKVGNPGRPVVCLVGDGGFLLNCLELETAVRERINVIVVVFNDSGFGNVRAYQKARFEGRYMCDFNNPPYAEMARLFNADGMQVERLDDLKRAITEGLRSDKPYVIDVTMDREELGSPGFL
jgi:acetolactate synthase-1/2/3 large subunit